MPEKVALQSMEITSLVEGDIAAQTDNFWSQLADIHKAAFNAIGESGWDADSIKSTAHQTGAVLVVAGHEGVVSGFALLRFVTDEVELITMAVDPAHAGIGIGQKILCAAIENSRDCGAQNFFLEVRTDNEPALRLYEKQGFQPSGLRPDYYKMADGSKRDAKILSLKL